MCPKYYEDILTSQEVQKRVNHIMDIVHSTFQHVFRKFYPQTLFYATRIVGEDDAEDVVQDAFIELWKRKDEIVDEEHIKAFLFRTTYTRALNVLKHRSITQNYAEAMQQLDLERARFYHPENNDTINRIENKELHDQIEARINELPDRCREVFVMSYLHDMKNKEIAELLNISIKTVEVHIYKALRFLRSRLDSLTFIFLFFYLKI